MLSRTDTGFRPRPGVRGGYQFERPRMELQEFLPLYMNKKLAAWVSTFPPDFYREAYRLHGWKYDPTSTARTPLVGKITNDVIYARLAPLVLEELKRIVPKNEKGRRAVTAATASRSRSVMAVPGARGGGVGGKRGR
ncbi:MAG TPA: P63C domain-containing protein [Urbifossiella sp.]|nr:P63C domain-containing protein [Urbifossiella sp.]